MENLDHDAHVRSPDFFDFTNYDVLHCSDITKLQHPKMNGKDNETWSECKSLAPKIPKRTIHIELATKIDVPNIGLASDLASDIYTTNSCLSDCLYDVPIALDFENL